MKPEDFVHLHNHSTYSLLEGLPSPAEIVARAKELGQTAAGIADKGYTYGLVEFYQYAQKEGIKPILGMDVYIAARTRTDKESGVDTKRTPLTLFAATQEGYQNLLQLATLSALEGMYYKPRVDKELLQKYGKGLIALTGPMSGAIPQAALTEDGERIKKLVEEYHSYFGEGNLYFELMDLPNVAGQSEINQQLIKYGKELGVPLVATCYSHYCRPEDAEAHDVLLCIQKNAQFADPGRFSMRDSDYSMRSFEEMERAFGHVPEALENTRAIADRCNVSFEFGKNKIPRFPLPNNETEDDHLTILANEGFQKLYPPDYTSRPDLPPGVTRETLKERLDYELSVIKQAGFSGYFLIVADFINEAKRRGITVGPGRGSAAGSMVSYSVGITTIDPIPHGLLFERFLNPERVSMPDVDVDFADTRRDEVLEYVREKYGIDHVVQICTFGTLAARAAVKDVGRAYGIPFLEMNALAKLIPERPGTKLKDALGTDEMKAAYDGNETYRKIIDTALKLEGKARHVSIHACGVIITEKPAADYTAVQRAPKDENIIITQYSAKPVESLGLLKMDFLGLTNLTVIQTALEIIERLHGIKIDLQTIPLDDLETFELLKRGDTTGVFQLESAGMRRYLKQLMPTKFGDITAMVALYRPGPMDAIPDYIKRKHHPELIQYDVPELQPFLEETYGIIVYQEQVQRVVQEFAGFSLGAGYLLIKAVAKKIPALLNEQKEKFLKGALDKGHKKKTAEEIFALIEPFSGYGFNKSHAAGYALIAYQTAYLKARFPTEFMAALLSSDAQRTDRVMIEIEECRAMGIAVLPPDINESLRHFTAILPSTTLKNGCSPKGSIRFGLAAIKGLGDSSVQQVIAIREAGGPFANVEDFAKRVPSKLLNKKLLEALVKSGALDSLGERGMLLAHYGKIADYSKESGDTASMQTDLFGALGTDEDATIEFPETIPATPLEKLKWEKETLGLYVSSHPLAGLKKYIGKKAQLISTLTPKFVGKKVTLAGLEEGLKKMMTKKGETMAIITLEDPTGKMEVTLFPRAYAQFGEVLEQSDGVLVINGTLDMRAGQLQLKGEVVKRASLTTMIERAKKDGFFDEEEAKNGMFMRAREEDTEEVVELLDEEGNVIAGERLVLKEQTAEQDEFYGPLGSWIMRGMKLEEALKKLELTGAAEITGNGETTIEPASASVPDAHLIPIHMITLPARAPKQLLLDLKRLFEASPGPNKVALKIGEQTVPVPLMITVSPQLEAQIESLVQMHTVEV